MSVNNFHPQQPSPLGPPPNSCSVLAPATKPPKEFADESSSISGGEGLTPTAVDHHTTGNVS